MMMFWEASSLIIWLSDIFCEEEVLSATLDFGVHSAMERVDRLFVPLDVFVAGRVRLKVGEDRLRVIIEGRQGHAEPLVERLSPRNGVFEYESFLSQMVIERLEGRGELSFRNTFGERE